MDIRSLSYFLAVAKCNSLTKAADELGTTQPHVSMVIRSLEEDLGFSLFKRKSKGVELTEAGRYIFSHAESVLKDVETIYQLSKNRNETTLKIASNPSNNLANLYTAYYERICNDRIALNFTECGIEQMLKLMSRDHYDLGFLIVPIDKLYSVNIKANEHRLTYVELLRSGFVLHIGKKHPLYGKKDITVSELQGLSFVQFEEDYFTIDELLAYEGIKNRQMLGSSKVLSTNSDHMMIQMLKKGKVCNLGTYWLEQKFSKDDFSMIPIKGYENKVSIGFLKHKNIPLSEPAGQFLKFMTEEVLNNR